MKKIALYTGCFDPVHKQHLAIINHLTKLTYIDEVWVLINGVSEEKNIVAPFSARKKMIELSLSISNSKIFIYPEPIGFYTTDLVKKLKKTNPSDKFYLVLGSDQANNLLHWENAESLPELVDFIIFPRQEKELKINLPSSFVAHHIDNFAKSKISSTIIRQGKSWNHLPVAVRIYIQKNCLYFFSLLEKHMSLKRFQHSVSVANLATKIARWYKIGNLTYRAYLAGLFHDLTKEFSGKEHLQLWTQLRGQNETLAKLPQPVWHAYTGALYVEKNLLISDLEIIYAIRFHTTGRAKMTTLEKIVFVADKLDPLKKHSETEEIRNYLFSKTKTFEEIFRLTFAYMVNKLKKSQKKLAKNTTEGADYYLN